MLLAPSQRERGAVGEGGNLKVIWNSVLEPSLQLHFQLRQPELKLGEPSYSKQPKQMS